MNKKRVQYFDPEEWNRNLKKVYEEPLHQLHKNLTYEEKSENMSLMTDSFLNIGPKNLTLTTKYGVDNRPCTYCFTLDATSKCLKSPTEMYALFMRSCKEWVPDYSEDKIALEFIGKHEGKFCNRCSGILKYNKRYLGKKVHAYEYDINSAYLYQLSQFIPDTRSYKDFGRKINEGEVGFLFDSELTLITKQGSFADVVFDLIETPEKIKRYCARWFDRKKHKIMYAKEQINFAIGYLQYHNPYMRSYIVHKCNYFINSLIKDETFILCNTDAVFSTVPLDLPLGTELGEFKLKEGEIEIEGLNYTSEEFGNCQRGVVSGIIYEVDEEGYVYGKESL
mgnify:CR=1 FL=1